jgi:hypothetical protein
MTPHAPGADRTSAARVRPALCAALLVAATVAARGDNLRIEGVQAVPGPAGTAILSFDIDWEHSWRHGSFHDAAWVFFKVRPDPAGDWQPVRLKADRVLNPTGYGTAEGTPLEFIVPGGADGLCGVFIRRSDEGAGPVATRRVSVVWDAAATRGLPADLRVPLAGFGIEMVYVAEGPFLLGSGGNECNRFHAAVAAGQPQTAYLVAGRGPIPTGRQPGRLWATGFAPEDGGAIPTEFPGGYGAFYCMKRLITQGNYADFLNHLPEAEARKRFYPDGHGHWIDRAGEPPNTHYAASGRPPSPWFGRRASQRDQSCPWLSWADGAAFAAWSGLRPLTELEHEKACRGLLEPTLKERGPSYFGVIDLNGGLLYERPVAAGSAAGRRFAGTHGRGVPQPPADWPTDLEGVAFRGDYLHMREYTSVDHMGVAGRMKQISTHADRRAHPLGGWRGGRTAPAGDAAMQPLLPRFAPGAVTVIPRADPGFGLRLRIAGPADLFPVRNRFQSFDYRGTLEQPWTGAPDLDATIELGVDGSVLRLVAEVRDDRHVNAAQSGEGIAAGDCLQIGLRTGQGPTWRLGLARTAAGTVFHQWNGVGDDLLRGVECSVDRNDARGTTRYAAALPLAVLGLAPGVDFAFNLQVVDDDDAGQRHTLRLAEGIATDPAGSDAPERFPRFRIDR